MKCDEYLKKVMRERELTQLKIAQGVGVTRQAVARWVNGESVPYGRNLEKLSHFLHVSPTMILFGEQEIVAIPDNKDHELATPDGFVSIPESKMCASAGSGYENSWDEITTAQPTIYRESFFKSRGIDPKKCIRVNADGDSMAPTICDGDKVLFCHERNLELSEIHDGDVYVLNIAGKLRIKRLATTSDSLIVRSDNPVYQEEQFTGDEIDSIAIFGKVIEITRTL